MVPHPDLVLRVERLFYGFGRSDDITALMLGLRDLPHATASIQEVGNFIAHRGLRNIGPVRDKTDAQFALLKYRAAHGIWSEADVLFRHLPPEFRSMIIAAWTCTPKADLASQTGLRGAALSAAYNSAIAKLQERDKDTKLTSGLKFEEERILRTLLNHTGDTAPFSGHQLTRDVVRSLELNKLIHPSAIAHLEKGIYSALTLHSMAAMHLSILEGERSGRSTLHLGCANRNDKKVLIVIAIQPIIHEGKEMKVAFDVFTSDLETRFYCDKELDETSTGKFWTRPVEIMRYDIDSKAGHYIDLRLTYLRADSDYGPGPHVSIPVPTSKRGSRAKPPLPPPPALK
jgi:hypothetical protein